MYKIVAIMSICLFISSMTYASTAKKDAGCVDESAKIEQSQFTPGTCNFNQNKNEDEVIELLEVDTPYEISVKQIKNNKVLEEIDYVPVTTNATFGYDIAKQDNNGYLSLYADAKKDEAGNIIVQYIYQNANGKDNPYYENKSSFAIPVNFLKKGESKEVYNVKVKDTSLIFTLKK